MALRFFEKVQVLSCPECPHRVGKFGHVLGMSYEDDNPDGGEVCGYGVFFDDLGEVYSFEPIELLGTGEIADRADFYTGESVRVRVDDGKGFLADE